MNLYADKQKQDAKARLRKCINELEVIARHFKVGKIWELVVAVRNELQTELDKI